MVVIMIQADVEEPGVLKRVIGPSVRFFRDVDPTGQI